MKFNLQLLFLFAVASSIASGCSTKTEPTASSSKLRGLVEVDGSSTVFSISEAVAEEFQKANRGVNVVVGISGTGGGFKKFAANEIDIVNASRPITQREASSCSSNNVEFLEIPIAYDGIVVVVHPSNNWVKDITTKELKAIWQPGAQNKITRWNQIRSDWPDRPLNLYGAGADSGTYDYFTEAIVGERHSSRGDYTSSEDDNLLVRGVASDKNALGFFGFAYYNSNRSALRAVGIDDEIATNGEGPVLPSVQSIKDSTYAPLSRPLLVYINKKSLQRPAVQAFMNFQIKHAAELSTEVGYVPLPPGVHKIAHNTLNNRITGSSYLQDKPPK